MTSYCYRPLDKALFKKVVF